MIKVEIIRLLVVAGLMNITQVNAVETSNLHVLAIANGDYYQSKIDEQLGKDIPGASTSAKLLTGIAKRKMNASSLYMLSSENAHYISREDVFSAVKNIGSTLSARNNDFLLVYYIGHGYGEGISWNYFLQPGNVVMSADVSSIEVTAAAEAMIYVGELNDALKELNVPYALLIDSCYEGKKVPIESSFFSKQLETNLNNINNIILFMNKFVQPNPVVFSAPPSVNAPTVKHPSRSDLPFIGPLLRRIIKYFDGVSPNTKNIQLTDMLNALTDQSLDVGTMPAVTHYQPEGNVSFRYSQSTVKRHVINGTAISIDDVKILGSAATNDDSEETNDPSSKVKVASLKVVGDKNEFITNGKSYSLDQNAGEITVFANKKNEISIEFFSREGLGWGLSFYVPPEQRLSKKKYKTFHKYPFNGDKVSMDISGQGSGCNEIQGEFDIKNITFDKGKIKSLNVSFMQYCDSATQALTGKLKISFF